MPRISKVSTKTGDDGTTGLADGTRLSKADKRVHLLGEVDELNAFIGLALSSIDGVYSTNLLKIQHDLFDIGAELCQPNTQLISDSYVLELDTLISELNSQLPALKEFILPSGSPLLAHLHICRTVCRRCERTATGLMTELNPITYRYLNRLSDFIFVFTRFVALKTNTTETYWQSTYSRKS